MNSGIEMVLQALSEVGIQPSQKDGGVWRGKCPSCRGDDRLTIRLTDHNGHVWMGCQSAQCNADYMSIWNAIGLTPSEVNGPIEEPKAPTPAPIKASSVKSRSIRWAWKGRLALAYLGVMTGIEGLGKSVFGAWLMAQITRGQLAGEWYGKPKNVLIVAGEDAIDDTWNPRLDLAGADLDRVFFMDLDKLGAGWNVRDGIDQLRDNVIAAEASFVFFDALLDHLPPARSGEGASQPAFVREALFPLKLLIRTRAMAGLMSLHPSKTKGTQFRDLVQLSQAFTAIPRIGLLFDVHPDDDRSDPSHRRVLLRGKGNIGRDAGALEFKVKGVDYFHEADGVTQSREVVYDVKPSTVTMADLHKQAKKEPTKTELAMDIIRLALSGGDWMPAAPNNEKLEAAGCASRSVQTEACRRLEVEKRKAGYDGSGWEWRIPVDDEETEVSEATEDGPLVPSTDPPSPARGVCLRTVPSRRKQPKSPYLSEESK